MDVLTHLVISKSWIPREFNLLILLQLQEQETQSYLKQTVREIHCGNPQEMAQNSIDSSFCIGLS
jgi:hypothetical protein